jgi:hypothetical protein
MYHSILNIHLTMVLRAHPISCPASGSAPVLSFGSAIAMGCWYVSNDFAHSDNAVEFHVWIRRSRIDFPTSPRGCSKELLRRHPGAFGKSLRRIEIPIPQANVGRVWDRDFSKRVYLPTRVTPQTPRAISKTDTMHAKDHSAKNCRRSAHISRLVDDLAHNDCSDLRPNLVDASVDPTPPAGSEENNNGNVSFFLKGGKPQAPITKEIV